MTDFRIDPYAEVNTILRKMGITLLELSVRQGEVSEPWNLVEGVSLIRIRSNAPRYWGWAVSTDGGGYSLFLWCDSSKNIPGHIKENQDLKDFLIDCARLYLEDRLEELLARKHDTGGADRGFQEIFPDT